jgi:GxxExxY protein
MNTDLEQTTTPENENHQKKHFDGLNADVTDVVLKVFFEVYNELGGGFLESVYHKAFSMALRQAGLMVADEVAVPAHFRGVAVGDFFADLTVNQRVLLELKAVSVLDSAHHHQILSYLRATSFEVGLLLNFAPKPQFKRFLPDNNQKKIRANPCESVVGSVGRQLR